jgi:tRNA(fMet)-specific endonuclease VapC
MMFILDTDTLSPLMYGQEGITERVRQADREVVTTVISRVEVLQGRFSTVLKAEDGERLLQAQERLGLSEAFLTTLRIIPIDAAAADEFDRLRANKKLKKIGRADLLIASIALSQRATLVTRNQKDFGLVPGLQIENWAD